LPIYVPATTLRWSQSDQLAIPSNISTVTDHAFQVAHPKLWNNLLQSIKTCRSFAVFKSQLKTYLLTKLSTSRPEWLVSASRY